MDALILGTFNIDPDNLDPDEYAEMWAKCVWFRKQDAQARQQQAT